jgi:hypothetical protein
MTQSPDQPNPNTAETTQETPLSPTESSPASGVRAGEVVPFRLALRTWFADVRAAIRKARNYAKFPAGTRPSDVRIRRRPLSGRDTSVYPWPAACSSSAR